MKVEVVTYDTATAAIEALAEKSRTRLFFRGHCDQSWSLRPSLLRNESLESIIDQNTDDYKNKSMLDRIKLIQNRSGTCFSKILEMFYRQCIERGIQMPEVDEGCHARLMGSARPLTSLRIQNKDGPGSDMSEWPIIILMQHFGFKTPMLDWTRNPLVGLFFAAENDSGADGCVWQFSDLPLSVMPASSNIDPRSKSVIDYKLEELINFNEKPLKSDCGIFIERPRFKLNERIIAQNGWLSISFFNSHNNYGNLEEFFAHEYDAFDFLKLYKRYVTQIDRALSKYADSKIIDITEIKKHIIPKDIKSEVIDKLSNYRVDRLSVYPGLSQVYEHMKYISKGESPDLFSSYFN